MSTAAGTSKDAAPEGGRRPSTDAARDASPRRELRSVVDDHFRRSAAEVERFFAEHDDLVARACLEMARRFHRGGRLLVYGEGAQRSDAEHVAVEFVHPVIVGKRALPALALGTGPGGGAERGSGTNGGTVPPDAAGSAERGHPVEGELRAIGRPDDIVMVVDTTSDGRVDRIVEIGRAMGMLTLALTGGEAPGERADLIFRVDGHDPSVAQEVLETLYHVLWELVHVFLDRSDALEVEA